MKPPGTPCPVQSAAIIIDLSPKDLYQKKSPPTISFGKLKTKELLKNLSISSTSGSDEF